MKRQLVLRLEAEAGIAEAVNYYKIQSEATVQKFIVVLDETFDTLLANPRLYAIRWKTTRRVNLPNFPYALVRNYSWQKSSHRRRGGIYRCVTLLSPEPQYNSSFV